VPVVQVADTDGRLEEYLADTVSPAEAHLPLAAVKAIEHIVQAGQFEFPVVAIEDASSNKLGKPASLRSKRETGMFFIGTVKAPFCR